MFGFRRIAQGLTLLLVAALVTGAPRAFAQEEGVLERRVKAAFLFKFTSYAAWPESAFARPDSPFTIGVLGDDALAAEAVQIVAGRTVDGRPLAVKRVTAADPGTGVHILFVSRAEAPRFAQILKALAAAPVLVVTESETAFRQGGAINFVVLDGRVRFDISQESADRRGVRLSSRLLSVARVVHESPQ